MGGAGWQGTRTLIAEEEDDAAEAAGPSSASRATAQAATEAKQELPSAIKWKKLARQILREVRLLAYLLTDIMRTTCTFSVLLMGCK